MDSIAAAEAKTLSRLGRSIGTSDFYEASLAFIAALVPRDMEWILIYDRRERPQTIHFALVGDKRVTVDRDLVSSTYEEGFYRFDPFFRYWRAGGHPSVIGMYEIVEPSDPSDSYLTEFMPVTGMADDIAVLLPLDDRRCMSLCIERATPFLDSEMQRLRSIYPLLLGLHDAHIRTAADGHIRGNRHAAAAPLDFTSEVASFTAEGLTPRERQIVRLILGGFPTETIANTLGIGAGTVRNHRKRLYVKLDITTEREVFSLFLGHLARSDPGRLV